MSSTPIPWTILLTSLGLQFPTIIVCVLGLTVAFTLLNKHPRAAPLVCVGLGLLLLASLTQPFVYPLIQYLATPSFSRRTSPVNLSLATSGVTFGFNVLRAIAIAIIAYAAFVDRPGHFYSAVKP